MVNPSDNYVDHHRKYYAVKALSPGIFIETRAGVHLGCDGHGRKMMFHPDKLWTRRDFLKLAGQAGLIGAVPTLAEAAATLNSDTVCISILTRRIFTVIFCQLPITTEILIVAEWRVALRKSGVGGERIETPS
jgi:hypothetical protein